jgi:hypothetical protein
MSKVFGFVVLLIASGSAMAVGLPNCPVGVPEIDPASAATGLTMLAGALAVIRGRRTGNRSDKH